MITCWGELLWDLFPDGPRLGGAAANVAYHASKLGEQVRLVSCVGDDALGKRALDELRVAGVDTGLVQVDKAAKTGTVHVQVRNGEPTFTIGERAAWDGVECSPGVRAAFAAASVVVFGTLAQRTPLARGALHTALAASPDSVRICDLNLRPPFATRPVVETALAAAHVVKLNEAEAEALSTLFDLPDPVSWLLARPVVKLVALTRGARGCLLAMRSQRVEHAGFPAAPGRGDRVGAGDAFCAALACAFVRRPPEALAGDRLGAIAELANRYASFVASEPGAMPAVPDELMVEIREGLAR